MVTGTAKLIIEVSAGLIPGTPLPEYTRQWGFTAEDWGHLQAGDQKARDLWIEIAGVSREYAASLESPARLNWVRRDWVWL